MTPELSIPLIAAAALVGWWLALRSNSSYRAVASPIGYLIITAAVLMCLLVVTDSAHPEPGGARSLALVATSP